MTYQQFLDRYSGQTREYVEEPHLFRRPLFKPRRAMIYMKCDMEHCTYCNYCVNLRPFCVCTSPSAFRLRPLLDLRKI